MSRSLSIMRAYTKLCAKTKTKIKTKLWFALELVHDKQIDPSMYRSTEGLVHLS